MNNILKDIGFVYYPNGDKSKIVSILGKHFIFVPFPKGTKLPDMWNNEDGR